MSVNNVAFLSPAPRPFARRGKSLVKTWKASYFGVRSTECYLPGGTLGVCASGPVLGGCGVHGLYAPGRSGNIVGSFEPGLERESSRAGEPEGCNRIQNTILRQRKKRTGEMSRIRVTTGTGSWYQPPVDRAVHRSRRGREVGRYVCIIMKKTAFTKKCLLVSRLIFVF